MSQNALGRGTRIRVGETVFQDFDIEAAEFIPRKIVEQAGCVGVAILLQQGRHLLGQIGESTENPAVLESKVLFRDFTRRVTIEVKD